MTHNSFPEYGSESIKQSWLMGCHCIGLRGCVWIGRVFCLRITDRYSLYTASETKSSDKSSARTIAGRQFYGISFFTVSFDGNIATIHRGFQGFTTQLPIIYTYRPPISTGCLECTVSHTPHYILQPFHLLTSRGINGTMTCCDRPELVLGSPPHDI
ncbi:hypothetical protein BC629DRAFT_902303 [Irpex lacteus]|nr:hypothetical protein BC629DRAFT_902303 [Irpex lacteus]